MQKIRVVVFAILLVALVLGAAPSMTVRAASCNGDIHAAHANWWGNFGWLGLLGGTPGYHGAVGMDPGATGYNNSTASANCNGN